MRSINEELEDLSGDDLVSRFYQAIIAEEIVVHYQPIVEFGGSRCVGAEALVRWRKQNGELLSPGQFLPQAERCGVMPLITRMVIERIAFDLTGILLSNPGFHISINFSPSDFESLVSLQLLQRMVKDTGIKPHQIWIEIPEVGFEKTEISMEVLWRAKESGFLIALDDFGVGCLGLSFLRDMPLDIIKIDKFFIHEIGSGRVFSKVIWFMLEMARVLGLKVVAEGVETKAQFEYLKSNHVNYSQGWLHARAIPYSDFSQYYSCNKIN